MAVPEWIKAHGIKRPNQVKFLKAFVVLGMISRAAEQAGINRESHYDWLKRFPEYKAAFDEAYEMAGDLLEDEAFRRAHDGYDKPVFYEGQECGVVREYSDSLMALQLKGRRARFRDKGAIELTGDVGLGALFEAMKKKPE